MERSIKYLYYRGARYASNLLTKSTNKIQDISYRGAHLIQRASEVVAKSTAPKMYRGVAY